MSGVNGVNREGGWGVDRCNGEGRVVWHVEEIIVGGQVDGGEQGGSEEWVERRTGGRGGLHEGDVDVSMVVEQVV